MESETDHPGWGFSPEFYACNNCGWGYLLPSGAAELRCPHCFESKLSQVDKDVETLEENLPYVSPPELVLPFNLKTERLEAQVRRFAEGIPYPPLDLTSENLSKRIQRVFIPAWLVDSQVQANWQAEAGFDYEVVSHQDRYSQGGWKSQEVKETRVRWEPRLGRLERSYPNLPLAAADELGLFKVSLRESSPGGGQPYTPNLLNRAFVRLPGRSQEDAWQEAPPRLQAMAAEEVRQAAKADHLRDFRWSAAYPGRNWTLLLLPLYTTYYLDDDSHPQAVYLHGQSGAIHGERKASPKRARKSAFVILAVAATIFLLGVVLGLGGLAVPPLLAVGGLGMIAGLLVALGAIIPPVRAWQFNRSQKLPG